MLSGSNSKSLQFKHLFNPLTVRHKTLKHRLNFGAHTANMAVDGLPVERHLHYYLERAIGGAAMIVVEPIPVHPTAVLTRGNFRCDDSIIPHFRKITDRCHEHGTVMIQQLYHVGAHSDWDNSFEPNWSPSGLPSMHDHDGSMSMSKPQIEEIVAAFAQAAIRAKRANFDGVELMAAYNALIEQFWSARTNRRDDRYGGSFAARMKFSEEVLSAIRGAVGDDFIIGICTSYDPAQPDFQPIEEMQRIAEHHDRQELVDYFTVGTGSYYDFTRIMPTAMHEDQLGVPFASAIKEAVTHAKVQAESHIRTPDAANQVIASGHADMVSIVRGQIADPHLANKAREGRSDQIRPCLSCNQMCWGRRYRDYWISCLINASAGREFEWGGDRFEQVESPRRVLVIGGGPAGCEAARVAAERGHDVTLVEASSKLGGQFRLAGLQPRRAQILDYLDWFERELERLGVDVRFNEAYLAPDVEAFAPDVLVLATGSMPSDAGWQRGIPFREELPGLDRSNVYHAEDVMSKNAYNLGKTVLLLDEVGTWKGTGTALYLAMAGHKVHLVTPWASVGRELTRTAADFAVREQLKKLECEFYCECAVDEWHGSRATVVDILSGRTFELGCDGLVLATVNESCDLVSMELPPSTSYDVHKIGDCVAPRQAPAAIYEGRKLALSL